MAEAPERLASGRRRTWWWIAVVLAVALAVVYGRALLESRAALLEARRLAEEDPEEAILCYRHAVEWYAPANPYSRQAVRELLDYGMAEIHTGADRQRVLHALESLRTGILVTRSFFTPYGETLPPVETRIAEIRAADLAPDDPEALQAEQARQMELLVASRRRAPDPFWSTLAVVAFLFWIGLTWEGIRGAYRPDGQLRRRRATVFGILSGMALALWILGLTLV